MAVLRPRAGFVFAHPAHFVAMGFGSGLSRIAPGTAGTLVAFPMWWLMGWAYPLPLFFGVLFGLFAIGVWACEITGRDLGAPDHGAMVWDEIVAFLLVLAIAPPGAGWQALAFVLFRAFDVTKPPPIRLVERRVKGGLGVMLDDLLAAGYALFVLALAKRMFF